MSPNDQSGAPADDWRPLTAQEVLRRMAEDMAQQSRVESRDFRPAVRPLSWQPPRVDLGSLASQAATELQRLTSGPFVADTLRAILSAASRTATATLQAVGESVQSSLLAAQSSDLWVLVRQMTLKPGITLLALDRIDEARVLAVIESALDELYVDWLSAEVAAHPSLDGPQRERLTNGLQALKSPGAHWTLPRDGLHLGLEGVLWRAARMEGVIDDRRFFTDMRRPHWVLGRHASTPAALLHPEHGLNLDGDLRRLLAARVLDSAFHDVRHARLASDNKRYALYSLLGLLAMLDRSSPVPWAVKSLGRKLAAPLDFEARDWSGQVTSPDPQSPVLESWRARSG